MKKCKRATALVTCNLCSKTIKYAKYICGSLDHDVCVFGRVHALICVPAYVSVRLEVILNLLVMLFSPSFKVYSDSC